MTPTSAIQLVSNDFHIKPTKFIQENIKDLILKIIKNAGSSITDFGKSSFTKTDDDENTNNSKNLATDKLDIDLNSATFSCMFQNNDSAKLIDICNDFIQKINSIPNDKNTFMKQTENSLKKQMLKMFQLLILKKILK